MPDPQVTLTTVNLGAEDPQSLARFYVQLLRWEVVAEEPDWVLIRPSGGGVGLSFQSEPGHVRPAWPARPGDQQMQMHLEIRVDDLESSVELARELGATLAEQQPQDDVRVCLDPAGHPFCLWLGE